LHGTFAAPERHLGAGDAVRIKGASTGGFGKSNTVSGVREINLLFMTLSFYLLFVTVAVLFECGFL
jgi:hypothetical protein